MSKSMALIGNLVSSGAGSNELRDNAIAGGLGGLINKIPGVGMAKAIAQSMKQEATGSIAQKVLPSWLQRSYGNGKGGSASGKENNKGENGEEGSGSKNDLSNLTDSSGTNGTNAKSSILGDNEKNNDKKDNSNENHNKPNEGVGNQLLNNAINNDNNNGNNGSQGKTKDYDDFYE